MSKSVPTLLGLAIILLVAILVVLVMNYQVTKGIGEGKMVVGTKGGEVLVGQDAPDEYIDASALGGRAEPVEARRLDPDTRRQAVEARQEAEKRQKEAAETGEPVRGGALVEGGGPEAADR
jgi:hypothetical protein